LKLNGPANTYYARPASDKQDYKLHVDSTTKIRPLFLQISTIWMMDYCRHASLLFNVPKEKKDKHYAQRDKYLAELSDSLLSMTENHGVLQ